MKTKTNYLETCIKGDLCKAEGCTEKICSGRQWDDDKPCVFYEKKKPDNK